MYDGIDFSWMDETIERIPKNNWMYKIACFITGRRKKKWTYNDMYIFLIRLNEKSIKDEKKLRDIVLNEILLIYKFQNDNKLPDDIVEYERGER